MPKRQKALPKRVYVKREDDQNDPDGSYLIADESTDSLEHGDTIGIYELVETRTMNVTKELK